MGKRLYVGNLAYSTTEGELLTLFSDVGPVTSVALITDRASGRSKGFAFVEMETDGDAEKAIAILNGKEIGGRTLTVNEAQPREPRSGGAGGGSPFNRGWGNKKKPHRTSRGGHGRRGVGRGRSY